MRLHLTAVVTVTGPCQSFIRQASPCGSFRSPSPCHISGREQALDLMFSTSDGFRQLTSFLSPDRSARRSFTSVAISRL